MSARTTRAFAASIPTMEIPAGLAEVEVVDAEGRALPLGSLWRERPAALFFVRHFG